MPPVRVHPQDPGKVWKGKKMAGRMGGKRVTRQNNLVYKVDTEDNLVFIKVRVRRLGQKTSCIGGSVVAVLRTSRWCCLCRIVAL